MPRDPQHSEHLDGVGNNRLMTGTSHGISLGTAALLMMGLTNRVGTITPAATAHQGNGAPQTFRLQATSKPTTSGYIDHTIEIPMTADISCERQLDAQALTDEMAREHGFATAKAWRKELGVKKDVPATIFSYPVTLTPGAELPHNKDKNGSRLNTIMDAAYDAWQSGGDKSIKRARKYFETQSEGIRTEAFQRIAPYKALSEEDRTLWLSKKGKKLHANGATPEELKAHQLPSDARAQRIFEPDSGTLERADKPPREARNGNGRVSEGNGWSVQYAKEAPREKTPRAPKPASEKPATSIKAGDTRHERIYRRGKQQFDALDSSVQDSFDEVPYKHDGDVIKRAKAKADASDSDHRPRPLKKHSARCGEDPLKSRGSRS